MATQHQADAYDAQQLPKRQDFDDEMLADGCAAVPALMSDEQIALRSDLDRAREKYNAAKRDVGCSRASRYLADLLADHFPAWHAGHCNELANALRREDAAAHTGKGAPKPAIPNLYQLYRAHVSGRTISDPDLTVFVEADSWAVAVTKISTAIAAMERGDTLRVAERIYNCHSAEVCIENGESADLELRIFEIGWGSRTLFVEHPVFLVPNPLPLMHKWLETKSGSHTCELLDALEDVTDLIEAGCDRNDIGVKVCVGNARAVARKVKGGAR